MKIGYGTAIETSLTYLTQASLLPAPPEWQATAPESLERAITQHQTV